MRLRGGTALTAVGAFHVYSSVCTTGSDARLLKGSCPYRAFTTPFSWSHTFVVRPGRPEENNGKGEGKRGIGKRARFAVIRSLKGILEQAL